MIEQNRFWFIPLGGTNTAARGMSFTRATFCVVAISSSSSSSLRLHHGNDDQRSGACRRRTAGTGAVALEVALPKSSAGEAEASPRALAGEAEA